MHNMSSSAIKDLKLWEMKSFDDNLQKALNLWKSFLIFIFYWKFDYFFYNL